MGLSEVFVWFMKRDTSQMVSGLGVAVGLSTIMDGRKGPFDD